MSSLKEKALELTQTNSKILDSLNGLKGSHNEVYSSYSDESKLVFEHKDYALSASQESTTFGMRSIIDGRLGFTTTNSSSLETQVKNAKQAQEIARISPKGEFHDIAGKVGSGHQSSGSYDEHIDQKVSLLKTEEILKLADYVVSEATSDSRISVDRIEVSHTRQAWAIHNSRGVGQSAAQASLSWYVMGMAKTDNEVTSFDYDGSSAFSYSEIEAEIKRSIGLFKNSVLGTLGARSGSSYMGPVLFHPYAVMDLIADIVLANCNGIRHQDGMSPWKDKVGTAVAKSLLTIVEDPLNKNLGSGWNPFDREGNPSQKHFLIKDGVLNFVAHNCFSAKRGATQPTGNSSGGARSAPSIGFQNVSVLSKIGGPDDRAIYKEFSKGLCLKRFSGNADPTSGQFSGVAKNSWWIENGERAYPVQEVMISGNLFDVLNSIQTVGSVSHKVQGDGLAPYIIVDGLSVTAG